MAATFIQSRCLVLLCLLLLLHDSPGHAGCLRSRCAGMSGLRREFRRTIDILYRCSRLLAPLTFRARNYTNIDYEISDSCNPTCGSPADAVMQDLNLTSSNWNNASRSVILEFHRRVFLDYSQQVTKSLADLSRAQAMTTHPVYLNDFMFMMGKIKSLLPRIVNIDRKLKGLTLLNPSAGQQSSSAVMRNTTATSTTLPQSLTTAACHFSGCVLENLLIESYQMIVDLFKIKSSL